MKLFLLLILASLPYLTHAQKAYETITFRGHRKSFTVLLKYADGYVEGSEIETKNLNNKKTTTFSFDSLQLDGSIKFTPWSKNNNKIAGEYFLVKIDHETKNATAIYHANSKVYQIVMKRE